MDQRNRRIAALACAAAACCQPALHAQESSLQALDASAPITYFIADGEPGSAYRASDRELAKWALEAWERGAGGALHFEPAPEATALVRVYWVPAGGGQYGEMRPVIVDGRHGAEVFIRPDTDGLGVEMARRAKKDPLLRDTIVYLTCLHELGHALGLNHTADYRDIMYFFGFGGDVPRFFDRYRRQLGSRDDVAGLAGLSSGDLKQLHALYGAGIHAALW